MTAKPLPFNLTVEPASQQHTHGPAYVRIADSGKLPLSITTRTVTLHSKCAMTSSPLVTVTPSAFTLQPGKGETVTVTAPASRGDFGVLFVARAPGSGQVHILGGVGSQLLSGGAVSCAPPKAEPPTTIAGVPTSDAQLFIIAVLIAAIILTVWGVYLRRKSRRTGVI